MQTAKRIVNSSTGPPKKFVFLKKIVYYYYLLICITLRLLMIIYFVYVKTALSKWNKQFKYINITFRPKYL